MEYLFGFCGQLEIADLASPVEKFTNVGSCYTSLTGVFITFCFKVLKVIGRLPMEAPYPFGGAGGWVGRVSGGGGGRAGERMGGGFVVDM